MSIHFVSYFLNYSVVCLDHPGPGEFNKPLYLNSRSVIFNFIVEPCIDTISINSSQLMHISVFIKNILKVHIKFLLPRHVSDHRGIHP